MPGTGRRRTQRRLALVACAAGLIVLGAPSAASAVVYCVPNDSIGPIGGTPCPKALYKARARIEQAVAELKRFKRIALRCEKTATNYGSFVAHSASTRPSLSARDSALAQSLVSQQARRLQDVVKNAFFACEYFNRRDHAWNDRKRVLDSTKLVFVGANHDPIERLLTLWPFSLLINDGIGADALNLALQ